MLMLSVHTSARAHTSTRATLTQRPIIEQLLLYLWRPARRSAEAIIFCLELEAANEKNWAIVKKRGQAAARVGEASARYDLWLK